MNYGKDMAGWVSCRPDRWYENLSLPLDAHMPLIDAGVIKDPVLADYCFDSEWIEKRSWWFKNIFIIDMICPVMELVNESLDIHRDVFLNGSYLGHQASAHYPFRREFDYQTKRLRVRACIALFCGNNENHWIFGGPAFADTVIFKQEKQYGLKLCNVLMPEIMRNNCPWILYWNSSPYGGEAPNSAIVGDVHHWGECMMNPDMALRIEPKEYDKVQARFVSEYGYPGLCPIKTIETYFDGKSIDRGSKIWNLHNNTFEKLTVNAEIIKHYTDRELLLDEYLLYAEITQPLMLEYFLWVENGNRDGNTTAENARMMYKAGANGFVVGTTSKSKGAFDNDYDNDNDNEKENIDSCARVVHRAQHVFRSCQGRGRR